MDYRETLNLPSTSFPMKGNLAKREPEIQEFWDSIDLYAKILEKNSQSEIFVLHDGPPYANGDIHVGTAYNKIIKDLIIKYKSMRGYRCPYVPGWDCHGLPIEHEVTKELGPHSTLGRLQIRKKCREHAMNFVERQGEQFRRLGVLGDFQDPYLTLDHHYEATNVDAFGKLYEKGLIYKRRKPIHWCTTCVTALAEAELEYRDKESSSVYVRFPLEDEFPPLTQMEKPVSMLIWTTTPWTLPANVAVALSPRLEYAGVETEDEVLVMARELVETVTADVGIESYSVVDGFGGSQMEGLKCRHPWSERHSTIVLADYVTLEQGTGCVHIAPGHGQEDYLTGLEYDLPSPMPVDDLGHFTEEAGPFAGMSLEEANPEIICDLDERGLLVGSSTVTHPYPHCWRCKNPVVFRATPQWFIDMDKATGGYTLRESALQSVENVDWIPGWTINRIGSMVEKRPDWCISRQRSWGVPLPVLYCRECGEELISASSLKAIRELIERKGSDSWFTEDPTEFLPEDVRCESCGSSHFDKETDIVDVWFESGISHLAVLRERPTLRWPAELYVEGSDQHRGWFQSSLLTSVGCEGKPPYRAVLTHGFTVDGEGRKMSKSLGNAIDPRDVYNHSGADVLRLWTASTDYSSDIPISEEILSRVTETYRRFRNTLRFLVGNLYDYEPEQDAVPYEEMEEIDRWMISRLQGLVRRVTTLMDSWLFHQAMQALNLFCTVDLSSLYLDILKDRLYTFPPDSRGRRSAQTAYAEILIKLSSMLAPVLSHTAEEVQLALPQPLRSLRSIHLYDWPSVDESKVDAELEEKWERLLFVREQVYRRIEEARQDDLLGTSLEARVEIKAGGSELALLREMEESLPALFIVSQVEISELEKGEVSGEIEVQVGVAEGEKCSRCWNYSTSVGNVDSHPDICERCSLALKEIAR